MIKIKPGVVLTGIRPEMLLAVQVAAEVYRARGCLPLTITSALDGQHSATSLHYTGCAIDFRTRHIADEDAKQRIVDDLEDALTMDYDVVLEPTHLHVEYQPRKPGSEEI